MSYGVSLNELNWTMRVFNLFLSTARDWSAWVGHGRVAPNGSMQMSIRKSVGDRVYFRVNVNGIERELSCQHEQWCQWLAPLMPITAFDGLTDELQQLAILWGMRNIAESLFPQKEVEWLSVTRNSGIEGLFPILTLNDEERCLDVHFIDWPIDELNAFTHDWSPTNSLSENDVSLCLEVCFGSFHLPLSDWLALRTGDGVFIDTTTDINPPVFSLLLQQQFVAQICCVSESRWEVVMLDSRFNEVESVGNMDVGNVNLCVNLQVGTMQIKVNDLVSMQKGRVLDADVLIDNQVKLICGGSVVGYGTLIKSSEDERWCVRINQINA